MLFKLCDENAASGFEGQVSEIIIKEAKKYADKLVKDSMGNLYAFKKGTDSQKTIMVSAHMDEVGFIISSITDDGYLKFRVVGGINENVLVGKRVTVGKNKIKGVTGIKAVHLMTKDERNEKPSCEKMYIDIGVSSREEALKLVNIGDYAHFDTKTENCGKNFIKAKALDDRCGCFIILELLKKRYKNDIYFCFVVQEEIGVRGATALSAKLNPDEAITVEGTTCLDLPFVEEYDKSTSAGDGAALAIADSSTYYDRDLTQALFECAEKAQLKKVGVGGTDGRAFQLNNIKAAAVAVPARYIHSPVSVVNNEDIENTIKLLENYLEVEKDA